MKLEHVAYNVADPVAMAAWYGAYLGLKIIRHIPQPAQTHFLSDGAGSIIEIYHNPPDAVPDYASMDPLLLHLAFVSADPVADQARLTAAGATFHSEVKAADGTHLIMLRDPWGLALQLCKRSQRLA